MRTVSSSELYQNVVSVWVSADGSHTAVCTKVNYKYRVIIDGTAFGPYDDVDSTFLSPWTRSNSISAFRAMEGDRYLLVIDGAAYGPYDEVWPAEFAGQSWGALVKQNGKYHVLVDGTLSAGFDEIAGDHRPEQWFNLNFTIPLDIPLFFGKGNWAVFARNGDDLFIVTKDKTYGPFQSIGIGNFEFNLPDSTGLWPADLVNKLSLDRSTLAVPVSKQDGRGAVAHYVWINGVEHGPLDMVPDFAATGAQMSTDGRAWAFFDQAAIYTPEGRIPRPGPRDAVVSDNGSTTMYAYAPDENMRLVVNGREYGPFKDVWNLSCSPDGQRWVANYRALTDNEHYVLTDSGTVGPYGDIESKDVAIVFGAYFVGNEWIWMGRLPDGEFSLLIDGKPYGPYKRILAPGFPPVRSTEKRWAAVAIAAERVDIFLTGKLHATTKPFDPIDVIHACDPHWHLRGQRHGQLYIVEDGTFSPIRTFKTIWETFHSDNGAKFALRAADENGQFWMVFSHGTYGPFPDMMGRTVIFSSDGSQWAFSVPTDEQIRVVSSSGESPLYTQVRDLAVTARGAAFVGIDASGQWWLHVGEDRHGPFAGCGLTESEGRLTAIMISGGAIKIQRYAGAETDSSD